MKLRVLGITMALLAASSCMKEEAQEQPMDGGQERFAEFDPVVRFGLDTYMGGADDTAPFTKTTYAGEDEYEIIFDKAAGKNVRYERINWNIWKDSPDPMDLVNKPDTIRIVAEEVFTKNKKKTADYSPWEIPGVTNRTGRIKDSAADAKEVGTGGNAATDNDKFYWELSQKPRYFYAVYPSPADRPGTYQPRVSVDEDDIDVSTHTISVSGSIPRYQKYLDTKVTGNVVEYIPDMSNAYMYAAAKIPSADAGHMKVPLRFKPLFSAVKLKVTAADAGAEKYRLKKVELRTDLFYDDLHQSDPKRVNQPKDGTPLNGDFTAKFGTVPSGDDKKPEYTGDFTVTDYTGKDPAARDTTNKRLTIRIEETDRVWLDGGKEVNITFMALPIDQNVMTVVYTFEVNDGSGNPMKDDKGNIVEVTRYLALQQKTTKTDNTGEHNEFKGRGWFNLPKATKLYVKSNVPEIQYYFEVDAQSFFPRTSTTAVVNTSYHKAQNFYSVVSYRDSSGVKQPLRWKVTGYGSSASGPFDTNAPHWLTLRGDDGDWANVSDEPDLNGTPSWGNPWGQGTRFDDADKVKDGGSFHSRGYSGFKDGLSYVYYDAGAKDNSSPKFTWTPAAHFSYKDPDGNYYYPANYPDPARVGEAYAYDLSHHDIYGTLLVSKNGEKGTPPYTTANCYVVSAPGWYRFPAVYGNGFKDGKPNEDAWKGDGGTYRLGTFKDHDNKDIEGPWITSKYTIDNVEILWQDADDLANAKGFATDSNRAEKQKPFFWKDPDTKYGYIYFYVNQVASANAVIAAKSGDTIVWSWHIWGVPDPNSTLEKVTVETSNYAYNSNSSIKNEFKYKNPNVNAVVWKRVDLGQGSKEDSAPYRYCYVKFSQYWRGKEIATRIVCFVQSGVEDSSGLWDAPTYQWGRKDPFRGSQTKRYTPYDGGVGKSLGYAIQNPTVLLYASASASWHGNTRYDNLWNTNVKYYPQTFDGFVVDGTSTGRKDTPVKKTVYDPCPPGFCVPNLFAFTGFNTNGLCQEKIPHGNDNLLKVTNHRDWTTRRPADSGFIDEEFTSSFTGYKGWPYFAFLAQNDDNVSWRRKIAGGEEVFFYARGRRNGGGDSTAGNMDQNQALSSGGSPISGNYWLAEPACSNSSMWSYGSVFIFSNNTSGTGAWVYPVAGASGGQAKWQRAHGCYIRPMVEP